LELALSQLGYISPFGVNSNSHNDRKKIQTWQNEEFVQQHYHDETTENTLIISSLDNCKTKRRKIPDRICNTCQYRT